MVAQIVVGGTGEPPGIGGTGDGERHGLRDLVDLAADEGGDDADVVGLAENLRLQATDRGVGVTLINPAMIDTPFWRGRAAPFAMAPEPVAEAIGFALVRPVGVDLNTITLRPIGQPV